MASRQQLIGGVWKALRQLDPRNVEAEASRSVRLAVVAPEHTLRDAAAYLLGCEPDAYERVGESLVLIEPPVNASAAQVTATCDVVLFVGEPGACLPGVPSHRLFPIAGAEDLATVAGLIARRPELDYARIPLARVFPALRDDIARHVIQTTGIENAAFVASTAIGNIIPNPLQPLTSVAESLGDLVVLTANQLRMLFVISAIFGRDVGYRKQAPEALSVIAAAFGWRALARELVAKIPFGGGVVPKAAIAFAATWATGDGIAHYYRTGERYTKEQLKQRFDEVYGLARRKAEDLAARMKRSPSGID